MRVVVLYDNPGEVRDAEHLAEVLSLMAPLLLDSTVRGGSVTVQKWRAKVERNIPVEVAPSIEALCP